MKIRCYEKFIETSSGMAAVNMQETSISVWRVNLPNASQHCVLLSQEDPGDPEIGWFLTPVNFSCKDPFLGVGRGPHPLAVTEGPRSHPTSRLLAISVNKGQLQNQSPWCTISPSPRESPKFFNCAEKKISMPPPNISYLIFNLYACTAMLIFVYIIKPIQIGL